VNATAEPLHAPLERARRLGFLGPGPIEAQITHARGFLVAEAALAMTPARVADLGTGGGVPGLVLAGCWPGAHVVLVESRAKRAEHLADAVAELGWEGRVEIAHERAEQAAHDLRYREQFNVVTARGFAAPAPTAEIAAGFVRVGGVLVVSEPPEADPTRWPVEPLHALGFNAAERVEREGGHFVVLKKCAPVGKTVPRRPGRPEKRPLW